MATSTVTVPPWTDGSERETCPSTIPLRVSIVARSPISTSRAWVSAIFNCAFSLSRWTTLASDVPEVTRWPGWTGTSWRTPAMPARTRSESICDRLRWASARSCSTRAFWASICAFSDSE